MPPHTRAIAGPLHEPNDELRSNTNPTTPPAGQGHDQVDEATPAPDRSSNTTGSTRRRERSVTMTPEIDEAVRLGRSASAVGDARCRGDLPCDRPPVLADGVLAERTTEVVDDDAHEERQVPATAPRLCDVVRRPTKKAASPTTRRCSRGSRPAGLRRSRPPAARSPRAPRRPRPRPATGCDPASHQAHPHRKGLPNLHERIIVATSPICSTVTRRRERPGATPARVRRAR
jgi:hypothetical protein